MASSRRQQLKDSTGILGYRENGLVDVGAGSVDLVSGLWDTVNFEGRPDPMVPGPMKSPVVTAALHAMCGLAQRFDGHPGV
jgi:hypothetical protein